MLYIVSSTILTSVVIAFLIRRFLIIKKYKRENELVVHQYGDSDIFLKRFEVEHFESLNRNEKRRLVARFQSQVKKGNFIKVYEKNKVVGYVKKSI